MTSRTAVIIPVLNEEQSLPLVLADIPGDLVDQVFVVDNGSTDRSADVARAGGAIVVEEPQRGYGAACLAGIAATGDYDILVFLDGDYSDYPEDLRELHHPVAAYEADMVIGSRMLRRESRRALPPQSRFGNFAARSRIGESRTSSRTVRSRSKQRFPPRAHSDLDTIGVSPSIPFARRRAAYLNVSTIKHIAARLPAPPGMCVSQCD